MEEAESLGYEIAYQTSKQLFEPTVACQRFTPDGSKRPLGDFEPLSPKRSPSKLYSLSCTRSTPAVRGFEKRRRNNEWSAYRFD